VSNVEVGVHKQWDYGTGCVDIYNI